MMRIAPTRLLVGIGLAWIVVGQRIRVDEEQQPVLVDGNTAVAESQFVPDDAMVEQVVPEETEQVSINLSNTTTATAEGGEPIVPISVLLFTSSPGPKACRGNVITNLGLDKPGSLHTEPTCYNVSAGSATVAQCGTFTANQDDGCEARLFNEPNCLTFANLAVFVPEPKPMGGVFRSFEITCGIKGVAPPPLNLGGLELPPNAQMAVGK